MTTKVRLVGAVPRVRKQAFLILQQIKPRNWTEIKDFCWCAGYFLKMSVLRDRCLLTQTAKSLTLKRFFLTGSLLSEFIYFLLFVCFVGSYIYLIMY